jgi:putative IMPACT (imprinted ancient) family translation regulator
LIFFNKAYYRESHTGMLIIEHSSVVTVAKWLDGSLKVKVDFKKPSSASITDEYVKF